MRGNFKPIILDYVKKNFPQYAETYREIYNKKNLRYWFELDAEIKSYAEKNNLEYGYNRDDLEKNFSDAPTIVNFFFHEKIKKSARREF